ncbi:GntR family transcriptional regulator [Oceanicella actignis]|uniref:DNA-binding transcriptional regulator, GntR family n=1 Tax=Oceanicella actignis TaxID=1189325 RepID=A0A1M7T9E7_9RHOB|nr:GntR family transcriptional regulator [Oceanicella actignis]TYO89138.1 DNA-binding GntR family transcriptional regulator [Oceanicella actignis]SET51066.1 transcriptional regulator, GntR family [Oceanicella actignis]SHN67374.1 DNA-binding transcriptional regulator, GntR family [Oceanicella actignis]
MDEPRKAAPREPGADAYSLILDAIDRGDYAPGARLVETELAERFGVSRTPIREALGRLEMQGLVAHDGRRGMVVASLDHDQLGELYEVRATVEGLAARLAARHAAPEEMAILRDLVEQSRGMIGDPAALRDNNRRFHRQMHRASHNRYLNAMLEGMRRSMALLTRVSLSDPGRGAETVAEHDAIVRAIEARDEDAAEAAARRHVSNAYATRLRLEAMS